MSSIAGERNAAQRLTAALTVALSEGTETYVMETKNVSGTGLCLCPIKVFPVGTQLHLVFGQPPELLRLSLEGVVRWSESGKGVGVEFTSIHPQDRQALLNYVTSQLPAGHA